MSYTGIELAVVSGNIQKYFTDKWMDLDQNDYDTPLANSALLETATIPKNKGQFAEFRRFDDFAIEATSGTDDTPKTYSETDEPSSPLDMSASVFQVPFQILTDYVQIGNIADATDPTGLIKKAYENFKTLVRRKIHMFVNSRCVKEITDNLREDSSTLATTLPEPFKNTFAGGVEIYENMTATSYLTMDDIRRGVSLLRNTPGFRAIDGDMVACILPQALIDQLKVDKEFREVVRYHSQMVDKVMVKGMIADWEGVRFIREDDPYRCKLASEGGALANRNNNGRVYAAHLLGKGAMGYVDFADPTVRRRLSPKFKVQDISVTGTGPTIGYRMAVQACVLNQSRGLNIFGCSKFGTSVTDLP
ncbi:MAG: hypothetical protein KJ899_15490 [Gammaproteobacteria bacterium]|nr:hypothetical protein [Gammaproteobacteria bacterium]